MPQGHFDQDYVLNRNRDGPVSIFDGRFSNEAHSPLNPIYEQVNDSHHRDDSITGQNPFRPLDITSGKCTTLALGSPPLSPP